MNNACIRAALAMLVCAGIAKAGPITVDFDLPTGTIVTDQYAGIGLNISAINNNNNPAFRDIAIVFDSNNFTGGDNDLETPEPSANGNAVNTNLGKILILAEDDIDVAPADGLIDDPDDQAGNNAGSIFFKWDFNLQSVAFHLIDIENNSTERGGEFIAIKGVGGTTTFSFNDLLTRPAQLGDPIAYGNNSINRVATITADEIGGVFNEFSINFDGSGAIDRIVFEPVPEPGTIALFGAAAAGFLVMRRRRKQS